MPIINTVESNPYSYHSNGNGRFSEELITWNFEKKEPTPADLIELSKQLPESDRRVEMANGMYDIYRAKSGNEKHFRNQALEDIVKAARWSYRKYYGSGISLLDEADAKSDIYVVQYTATQDIKKENSTYGETHLETEYTEFSSLRFVPLTGTPPSNEDFDYYVYSDGSKRVPVRELFREKFPELSDEEFENSVVTQSRFCPVRPFPVRYRSGNTPRLFSEALAARKSNYALGIPFALMNEQYFLDHQDKDTRFITCQMHDELANGILSYPAGSGKIVMPFTPASSFFNVPEGSIHVDRDSTTAPFLFPGYFLHLPDLVETLDTLVTNGNLPNLETIPDLLPQGASWETIKKRPSLSHFANFGTHLLTKNGAIDGTTMSGEELREAINSQVRDGARWRVMDASEWRRGISDYLNAVDEQHQSFSPIPLFSVPA